MMDQQTRSLWSQLLGECVKGPLQGKTLDIVPSDMITWGAWRQAHPRTTVLDLSHTAMNYTRDFYRQKEQFVLGLSVRGQAFHASLAELEKQPLLNLTLAGRPVLISFDPSSTSARVYLRQIEGRTLTFAAAKQAPQGSDGGGWIRDQETGTLWNRATGTAVEGALRDQALTPLPGIMSFTRKWKIFHPQSTDLNAADVRPQD